MLFNSCRLGLSLYSTPLELLKKVTILLEEIAELTAWIKFSKGKEYARLKECAGGIEGQEILKHSCS